MAAMPLPPLNMNSNATSRSGEAVMSFGPKSDSFNVNYGSGGIGAAMPWWAWAAAGAAAILWLKRKG